MKIFKVILLTVIAFAGIQACKDKEDDNDNNNNNSGKTRIELLTQGQWKINSLVSNGTDIWSTFFVDACNKDNLYKFRTDDSLAVFDMALKCNSSDPDSTVSYYELYNNNSQIILNVKLTSTSTLNDTADISELSESTLKLNAVYSGLPATITFKHP